MKSNAVYVCPDDSQPRPGYLQPRPGYLQPRPGYLQPRPGYLQPRVVSYAQNTNIAATNPFWVWTTNPDGSVSNTGTATDATLVSPASTVLIYETPGALGPNAPYAEPLSKQPTSSFCCMNGVYPAFTPAEGNSASGNGLNYAWQTPVVADRHGNFTLSGAKLVGFANFILADGHVKFMRVSPEDAGKGGAVSTGGMPGLNVPTCVGPDNLAGTGYVATFCTK